MDFSRDIAPALINWYARENDISPDSALVKLSEDNWKGLEDLYRKFIENPDFREEVLAESPNLPAHTNILGTAKEKTEIAQEV